MHKFRNNQKLVQYSDAEWESAQAAGLLNISACYDTDSHLIDQQGHRFINMVSCSYLGLEIEPMIQAGAMQALKPELGIHMGSARIRVRPKILDETEANLSDLFQAPVITSVSCGVASCGVLPLISSGHITDTPPLVMVFDKHAHFSLNIAKPICADEAEVITAPHNDLNFLEDICKQHPRVAYVCDGVYSMGDKAPIKELLELQNKYGLFLYIDDSHALSVYGKHGEGFARMHMPELSDRTMIVSSLWKGFGAHGSALMVGAKNKLQLIQRYGGGFGWSQYLTSADCGAIIASANLHRSPRLAELQKKLQKNIQLIDELIPNSQVGNDFPIRVLRFGEAAAAIEKSRRLFEAGFYASAVFFPVVERGNAGLRMMVRADIAPQHLIRFAALVNEIR